MTSLTYAVEPWSQAQPGIAKLVDAHWREIALDHASVKLAPNWDRYKVLEAAGMLLALAARDETGEMVGYFVGILNTHLHYENTTYGWADVYYLRPEFRNGGHGYKLLKHAADAMFAAGAQKLSFGTKLHKDMGHILERLGFTAAETLYTKVA